MSNQKLLYNIDSKNVEVNDSSSVSVLYYDNVKNSLIFNNLIIANLTSSIGSGILSTNINGNLSTISTSSVQNNSFLRSNGTSWQFVTGSSALAGNFTAGSDISGSFSFATVRNIGNITTGILSAKYGGTGVSSFQAGGLVIKDTSDTIKFLKPDSANAVLRSGPAGWYSGGATSSVITTTAVTYLDGAVGNDITTNWTKPQGHKNIRVILMGGGGGGGSASQNINPFYQSSGFGGGSGGFSIYDFKTEPTEQVTATITAGGGGRGSYNTIPRTQGAPGGASSFIASNGLTGYAYGGGGGLPGAPGGGAGIAGWGNVSLGYGNGNIRNYTGPGAMRFAIASGGGGGGNGTAADGGQPLLINSVVAAKGASGVASSPAALAPTRNGTPGGWTTTSIGANGIYAKIGGGGGGTLNETTPGGVSGGNGIYGSGGGGAGYGPGISPTSNTSKGGDGGPGYVIVISW